MVIPSIKWLKKINCKDVHNCDLYFFVDDSKHVEVEFKIVNENHVFLYTSNNNKIISLIFCSLFTLVHC